jgi:hypothetical protein
MSLTEIPATHIGSSFNPEISKLVTEEGGSVLYTAGNILVVSEVSKELYFELLKSPYVDTMESLPLKRYNVTQTSGIASVAVQNTTAVFEGLPDDTGGSQEEYEEEDAGNVSGGVTSGGAS